MKDRNKLARVLALILAALMAVTTLASALSMILYSADQEIVVSARSITADQIRENTTLSLSFRVPYLPNGLNQNEVYAADHFEFGRTPDSDDKPIWEKTIGDYHSSGMTVTTDATGCTFSLNNITYVNSSNYRYMVLKNIKLDGATNAFDDIVIRVSIPRHYFTGTIKDDNDSSGGSSGSTNTDNDDKVTYTSNIVFETTTVRDVDGKVLDKVDKDTEPFSVEVVYTDTGLRNAEVNNLRGTSIQTYFVPGGSFEMTGTTKGTVQYMTNSGSAYPRFRVTFSGLTYTGTGNELNFQVYYLFNYMDDPVKGEGKASLYEAKPDDEDDDDDKMGMAVPKIIIDNYTYGDETIVAGSEFNLSFSMRNTSSQLPLENIVVTLTPASNEAQKEGPGLIVASSSNTIYVPELGVGASMPYNIAFQARPDAEVTSHIIQIKFSYEYIDTAKKSRETAEITESIAIPVSQIDRFALEPILETPYALVGEEAYLTVNFVNRGKSSTNNIAVSVRCDSPAITAPAENYGNLEAGKADSVDLYITSSEVGEFSGEVVVEYEDENMNVKELTTPFTMLVEEPWFPPMDEIPPDDMFMEQPSAGPSPLSIALCSIGGLGIAGPIALYLMKRVRAKASEDLFDEDI